MLSAIKHEFSVFADIPWFRYGQSTQEHGPMNIKVEGDLAEYTARNREEFLVTRGRKVWDLVIIPRHEHGLSVFMTNTTEIPSEVKADGLVTNAKRTWLTARAADCRIVFMCDPKAQCIGLVHCGWKGAVLHAHNSIMRSTIEVLRMCGSNVRNICVGVGPGLCEQHFEIREDVWRYFIPYASSLKQHVDGVWQVNFGEILRRQALDNGVLYENIEISPACTYCLNNLLWSRRRWFDEKRPPPVPMMMAYAVIV